MRLRLFSGFALVAAMLSFAEPAVSQGNGDFVSTAQASASSGWEYPDPSKIRRPTVDNALGSSERVEFTIDYSRCTGGGYRYDMFIMPYDVWSTKQIEGRVKKHASTKEDQYYFKMTVDLPANGWNGRMVLTDQPELHNRTDLFGVRVMTDARKGIFTMWPEAKVDEETGEPREFIAPLIYYYFSNTPTADRTRGVTSDDKRGYGYRITAPDNPKGKVTAYIQYC